jgi:hypothetical protein
MDQQLTVSSFGRSRLLRSPNKYTSEQDSGVYFKVSLNYGLRFEYSIDLWFKSEAEALKLKRPGIFLLSDMWRAMTPGGLDYTVDDVVKELRQTKNRYTGLSDRKPAWRTMMSNDQLDRYVDLWYQQENEARVWSPGQTYNVQEILENFDVIADESGFPLPPVTPPPPPPDSTQHTTVRDALIRDYQLNNALTDALGGPSLVNVGGTVGLTAFTWTGVSGTNQGATLAASAFSFLTDYSIELYMKFTAAPVTVGNIYSRILGVFDPLDESGLYFINAPVNTMFHCVLTRDGGTQRVNLYYNGGLAPNDPDPLDATSAPTPILFDSANNNYVSSFADTPGNFLVNTKVSFWLDNTTGLFIDEVASGSCDLIRVYNRSLSAFEVGQVYNDVVSGTGTKTFWRIVNNGAAGTYDGTTYLAGQFPLVANGIFFGVYTP